jgi:hypothetical protein
MSLEELTDDQRNSIALKKLFNHPELGMEAKRLYKKVVPDARFPDLEIADRLAADKQSTDKEVNDLREKVQLMEIQARRTGEHAKIREAGLDPNVVEKVMTDEKISSYDTAIKYLQAQQRGAPSTPASITPIRMPDNLSEIQKDPRKWAQKTAHDAINELISQRRG